MENNISSLRKAKGFSAQELADIVGTSQQQIDRLEKGQRKLTAEWMQKLSQALSCKPAELIDFAEKPAQGKTSVPTAIAKVIGAIETRFSNSVREFASDEQYEISFRMNKKDIGQKFFALVVEGGSFKTYPANSELVFTLDKSSPLTTGLAESNNQFISSTVKNKNYKFTIGKKVYEGQLVKSIRSE